MRTIEQKLRKEGIVQSEPAMWVDSESVMQNGRLILTKGHLIFMLNSAKDAAIAIDLDTINSISHERIITDNNILSVTYLQYYNAKFSVTDYSHWEKWIEAERMQPNI